MGLSSLDAEITRQVVLFALNDVSLCAVRATCRELLARVASSSRVWQRESLRAFGDLTQGGEDAMARHLLLACERRKFHSSVDVVQSDLSDILSQDRAHVLIVPGVRQLRPWGGALNAVFDLADETLGFAVAQNLEPVAELEYSESLWIPGSHGLAPSLKGLVFAAGPHVELEDHMSILHKTYMSALDMAANQLLPCRNKPTIVCVPISTGGNRVSPRLSAFCAMRQAQAMLRAVHFQLNVLFVSNERRVVAAFNHCKDHDMRFEWARWIAPSNARHIHPPTPRTRCSSSSVSSSSSDDDDDELPN